MFPKKLRTELAYQPGVIGWGLIIHESWDWVILTSHMLLLMAVIGVSVVLFAVFTDDLVSAFGFGAYTVTLITVLLNVNYWRWKEQEGP